MVIVMTMMVMVVIMIMMVMVMMVMVCSSQAAWSRLNHKFDLMYAKRAFVHW